MATKIQIAIPDVVAPPPDPGFRLLNSKVMPLTEQYARHFHTLPASPTERELNDKRVMHLHDKATGGLLIPFQWSTANYNGKTLRMNGQHSSAMLCAMDAFPKGLWVHLDEYEVDSIDGLAMLFRQFDDRRSGRSSADVSGAYQGLFSDLAGVPRDAAKKAIEGVTWYLRVVEGVPVKGGDDQYTMFNDLNLHEFIKWLGGLFSIKTPELKRKEVVAAMYATYLVNRNDAEKFWIEVARGGVETEDEAPSTVLDAWLKVQSGKKADRQDLKAAQYYQGCIFAWNAHRDGKDITGIKCQTTKGLYTASK